MTSQQESERRFNGRRWTAQQIAGALFALVVAGGGGGWLWTHQADDGRELGEHSKSIADADRRITAIENNGSRQAQVLESRVTQLEARTARLETSAVTQATIIDLQHQIENLKAAEEAAAKRSEAADTELGRKLDGNGNAVGEVQRKLDALWTAIIGEGSKRIGPYK